MTIKDIARESGCAVSTVSRALNDHPDVSLETKRRVQEVVARHGFVPNANARRLKVQQSRSVNIVVKGVENMFFADILERIQSSIAACGYAAQVHYIDEEANEVLVGMQLAREVKPLGILFLGGNVEEFQKRFGEIDLPCVLATAVSQDLAFPNLSCVGIDDAAAGAAACRCLLDRGHRAIGVIGGNPQTSHISALRYEGFAKTYAARTGAAHPEALFIKGTYSLEGGYLGMRQLLAQKKSLTAVFCMSDLLAIGAMRAVHEAGLSVPGDISVLGFDGIRLGQFCTPQLASVRQPAQRIAEESVALLTQQIQHGAHGRHVVLESTLISGESVRAL